jgi:hypothetical protein
MPMPYFSNTMSQVMLLGIIGGIVYFTYFGDKGLNKKLCKKNKKCKKPQPNIPQPNIPQPSYYNQASFRGNISSFLFTDNDHFEKEFLKINTDELNPDEILSWFQTLKNKEVIS